MLYRWILRHIQVLLIDWKVSFIAKGISLEFSSPISLFSCNIKCSSVLLGPEFVPAGRFVVSLTSGMKPWTFKLSVTAIKRSADPKSEQQHDLLWREKEQSLNSMEVDPNGLPLLAGVASFYSRIRPCPCPCWLIPFYRVPIWSILQISRLATEHWLVCF